MPRRRPPPSPPPHCGRRRSRSYRCPRPLGRGSAGFEKVGADEARDDGDEPAARTLPKRVDTHSVEQDGELVHQCNIEVALGVLDHFGGLGDLEARCPYTPTVMMLW